MTNKLIVEQIKNKKVIKRWKLRPETSLWSVGSSPGAELKILDFSWDGIAGCIEYNGKSWKYIDFQNKENRKKETEIQTKLTVQYGQTELHILPVGQPRDLFDQIENNTPKNAANTKSMQQIVVRCNNKIIETHVWTSKKPFKFPYLKDRYVYPTESMNWESYSIGPYYIQQRRIMVASDDRYSGLAPDPSLKQNKRPYLIALAFSFLFPLAISFLQMPQHTEDETADLNREQLKMFQTRIKPGKQHRQQQVTQMQKKAVPEQGKQGKNSSSRRLGSIQKAGLQSLIGKISNRARQTSRLVAATGKTPNFDNLGKAVASIGSISANTNGNALGGLGTNKLGIGTMGKGGGNTGYLGSGNLKSDGVGTGNVGLLEEESEIYGGLDREVIAEYIRSKLGQILYCYERQLSANPDLFGKVEVKFTIGGTGYVSTQNIGTTSLKNQRVESCILQKISAWKFPSPKGGTQVRVTYPFLFKSMN